MICDELCVDQIKFKQRNSTLSQENIHFFPERKGGWARFDFKQFNTSN